MNAIAELTVRFEDVYGRDVDEAISNAVLNIREPFPFECMTIRHLKPLASAAHIKRYSHMTKHELYTALSWYQECNGDLRLGIERTSQMDVFYEK